jgi:hypothetical protein
MDGITFDAGGLIALDRNDRRVIVLLARAPEPGGRVIVPATALAQAIRNPSRQARLSRLIRQVDADLVPLDGADAAAVGLLLSETRAADIVDAHVVLCARRTGHVVVTGDPGDIARIDPELTLVAVSARLRTGRFEPHPEIRVLVTAVRFNRKPLLGLAECIGDRVAKSLGVLEALIRKVENPLTGGGWLRFRVGYPTLRVKRMHGIQSLTRIRIALIVNGHLLERR